MRKQENSWILKDWTVYPKINLIQNHQSEFSIKPRLMKLLVFFLMHANEVVTKDAILDFVWEDRIVTENLLTKSISELRKLLDTHFKTDLQIETIRNVGYRFHSTLDILPHTEEQPTAHYQKKQRTNYWLLGAILASIILAVLAFNLHQSKQIADAYKVNFQRISSLKGQELSPTISPDGKNIAFIWREAQTTPFGIYVKSLQEAHPRKLTNANFPEYSPIWSLDGSALFFLRINKNDQPTLVKKSIIGNDETKITQFDGWKINQGFAWSLDGQQLIFSAKKSAKTPFAIYQYNLDTDKVQQLTYPPLTTFGDIFPISPIAKRKVGFIRASKGKSILSNNAPVKCLLYSLDIHSKVPTKLFATNREIKEWGYHPKLKQYLYWTSQKLGNNQLIAIDQSGQQKIIHTTNMGMPGRGTISSDHIFYFENWYANLNVNQYAVSEISNTAIPPKEFLNSTLWDWGLRFARNGDNMAFISNRSGQQEIWVAPESKPQQARQITDLKKPSIKSLSLSPDGQQILFSSIEHQQNFVFLIASNGKDLKKLSFQTPMSHIPEWSLDGQTLFFGAQENGHWQLWQTDLSGNPIQKLPLVDGYTVRIHPKDADKLYFTKYYNQDTIWQYQLSTGVAQQVAVVNNLEGAHWYPTQFGIYFLSCQEGNCFLNLFDFQSKQKQVIRNLPDILPGIPPFTLSKDEQSIFITHSDAINADLMAVSIE